MHGVKHSVSDCPIGESAALRPPPLEAGPGYRPSPPGSAIVPRLCAGWARSEGIGLGDTVALLMRRPSEVAALRQGLAWAGARAVALDPATDAGALAGTLSTARAAVVDTALAETYAGLLGRLDRFPPVWWNGAGADFARLDLALAEADGLPDA